MNEISRKNKMSLLDEINVINVALSTRIYISQYSLLVFVSDQI